MEKEIDGANKLEASPDSKVAKEPSFAEAMAEVFAKSNESKPEGEADGDEEQDDATTEEESTSSDGEAQKLNPTGEQAEAEAEKEDAAKPTPADDTKLPFHDHPRWKEVIGENQSLRAQKPLVDQASQLNQFCDQHRITPEELNNSLNFLRLFKTNPEEARKFLEPTWKSLEGFVGNELPADLQAKVLEGKLEETDARELARLRAQTKVSQQSQQSDAQWQAQQEVKATVNAVNSWGQSKTATDPGFKPKVNGDPDGKFELVFQKMGTLVNDWFAQQRGPMNQANAIKLAEQAYTEVNRTLSQFMPRRRTSPNVTSNRSSGKIQSAFKPKTLAEAIAGAARGERLDPEQSF